jgi:hypothetical protein
MRPSTAAACLRRPMAARRWRTPGQTGCFWPCSSCLDDLLPDPAPPAWTTCSSCSSCSDGLILLLRWPALLRLPCIGAVQHPGGAFLNSLWKSCSRSNKNPAADQVKILSSRVSSPNRFCKNPFATQLWWFRCHRLKWASQAAPSCKRFPTSLPYWSGQAKPLLSNSFFSSQSSTFDYYCFPSQVILLILCLNKNNPCRVAILRISVRARGPVATSSHEARYGSVKSPVRVCKNCNRAGDLPYL